VSLFKGSLVRNPGFSRSCQVGRAEARTPNGHFTKSVAAAKEDKTDAGQGQKPADNSSVHLRLRTGFEVYTSRRTGLQPSNFDDLGGALQFPLEPGISQRAGTATERNTLRNR
jgi:hypothetical protein